MIDRLMTVGVGTACDRLRPKPQSARFKERSEVRTRRSHFGGLLTLEINFEECPANPYVHIRPVGRPSSSDFLWPLGKRFDFAEM